MRSQSILARLAFGGFVLALAIALVASFGTRFRWWSFTIGLELLYPCAAAGVVGFVAGTAWIARSLARNTSEGWRYGAVGLAGAAIVVGVLAAQLRQAYNAPPIHDVSTDSERPPDFESVLALRRSASTPPGYDGAQRIVVEGKNTTVAAAQHKFYPDIRPYAILVRPGVLFWRAFETAKAMGWNIVAFGEKSGRIEATDTSFWFGLTDDIVIRVRPAGTLGARLDIRSESRMGGSDRGRNAARVRDYLKRLSGA
jgi:hypothetical protein